MAIQNFSICALNIDENCIETLDTFTQNNVFHITLLNVPAAIGLTSYKRFAAYTQIYFSN